jgi:hypothetical protein
MLLVNVVMASVFEIVSGFQEIWSQQHIISTFSRSRKW